MADILDLNAEEEFEGVEGDREVRMKDDEDEETVSRYSLESEHTNKRIAYPLKRFCRKCL
jgi:hypothetical protein